MNNSSKKNVATNKSLKKENSTESENIDKIDKIDTISIDSPNCVSDFFSTKKSKTPRFKMPNCKISRGLLATIIFFILFCCIIVWFINDFEGILNILKITLKLNILLNILTKNEKMNILSFIMEKIHPINRFIMTNM